MRLTEDMKCPKCGGDKFWLRWVNLALDEGAVPIDAEGNYTLLPEHIARADDPEEIQCAACHHSAPIGDFREEDE